MFFILVVRERGAHCAGRLVDTLLKLHNVARSLLNKHILFKKTIYLLYRDFEISLRSGAKVTRHQPGSDENAPTGR